MHAVLHLSPFMMTEASKFPLFTNFSSRYFVCVPVDGDRVDVFTLLYRKLASKKVRE